jgi:hypothetical protein
METDKNIRLIEEHRKDLLRQADQYRLVQQALANQPDRVYFWWHLIHWVGELLINLGCFIQTSFRKQTYISTEPPSLKPCEERA